jgi:hypothetical protein
MTRNISGINIIPNSMAILGNAYEAASVALYKVLQPKDEVRSTLILDYTGRGAIALDGLGGLDLSKKHISWYDLADRFCPVSLFQLSRSEHFRPVLLNVLKAIREISRISVSDATCHGHARRPIIFRKPG